MNKTLWVEKIHNVLANSDHFTVTIPAVQSASLVFACDLFRRRKHDVHLDIEASETGTAILKVFISKIQHALEFTIRRDDVAEHFISQMEPHIQVVAIRGCGTVIQTVFQVIEWAIHNGWLLEKSFISTLTQRGDNNIQRNTTFSAILRKG